MDTPLTLNVVQISPPSLIPSYIPSTHVLPASGRPLPALPEGFTFSPTPNYPTPFGIVSLGSTLSLKLELKNTSLSEAEVLGVRMMVEVQGPSGRYRLGEVVHSNDPPKLEGGTALPAENPTNGEDQAGEGETPQEQDQDGAGAVLAGPAGKALPSLGYGESVSIKVDSEMKDLGLNVVIVSAAWETLEGRRTMQRFLKFNVNPPLAIKTRIQTPTHPNTSLDASKRERVYLEVLMQNVSRESMALSRVFLEAVQGLKSRSVSAGRSQRSTRGGGEEEEEEKTGEEDGDKDLPVVPNETLLPNDTRQYLFILSPSTPGSPAQNQSASASAPTSASASSSTAALKSVFPPSYPGGTILPLGRLDVTWVAGVYHVPGRLQTSTLNRRVPINPVPTSASLPGSVSGLGPRPAAGQALARTLSAQSQTQSAQQYPLSTPTKDRERERNSLIAPSRLHGKLRDEPPVLDEWEFDLTLAGDREAEVGEKFKLSFRLGVRSAQITSGPGAKAKGARKGSVHTDAQGDRGDNDDDDDDDIPLSRRVSRVQDDNEEQTPEHDPPPPPAPTLAIQYLTSLPATSGLVVPAGPHVAISPPSRSSTPLSPPGGSALGGSSRPFSPLGPGAQGQGQVQMSRPMTPLSTQLRQAQSQGLTSTSILPASRAATPSSSTQIGGALPGVFVSGSGIGTLGGDGSNGTAFPPPPYLSNTSTTASSSSMVFQPSNQVIQIGHSMLILPTKPLVQVEEDTGPTYSDATSQGVSTSTSGNGNGTGDEGAKRWESVYEFELEFVGFEQGLNALGGLRVLLLDDSDIDEGHTATATAITEGEGKAVKQWDSLGDLIVWG